MTRRWRSRKDRLVGNFPFRDPVVRRKLDREDVAAMLLTFEDTWAETTGERITSTEFYERYAAGEFDSILAMAWASHYEVYRQFGDEANREVVAPLVLTDC